MGVQAVLGELIVLRQHRRVGQRTDAQLEAAVVRRALRERDLDGLTLRLDATGESLTIRATVRLHHGSERPNCYGNLSSGVGPS